MPMYKLTKYSDNYSDIPESLWQFKRDQPPNADLGVNSSGVFNAQLFKYKAALLEKVSGYVNPKSFVKKAEIAVPWKYLSNLWRSLEVPLINWAKLDWRLHLINSTFIDSTKC